MGVASDSELRDWVDRQAITDVIYRYSDAVTRADWDQCETVFVAEAVWESPVLGLRFESAREFCDFLADTTSNSDVLIQTPHAPVVRLEGPDRASATVTLHEFVRGTSGADVDVTGYGEAGGAINFEQYGVYFDDLVRRDSGWKFTHRLFVPIYVGPDAVSGDVLVTRPSPLLRP